MSANNSFSKNILDALDILVELGKAAKSETQNRAFDIHAGENTTLAIEEDLQKVKRLPLGN